MGIAPLVAQENQQMTAQPNELSPSPLEAFAARSTATVVWSKTIGRFESSDAAALLTAVIIKDQAPPVKAMRGLRIDLAHTGSGMRLEILGVAHHVPAG